MTIMNASVPSDEHVAAAVRSLIAAQLEVHLKRVTDQARLIEDLGADWLDRLELMIAVEDRFTGVDIGEDEADEIRAVGDLIRFVQAHPPG